MSQNICNICGANYEYRNGRWKCPACGAFKAEELSNEEVTLFYNAAQKLRLCDFDEAEKAYTDIIEKFPKNPNGYWERLLSRYGIKYEEDFDGRKIPTCYATSIESIISDKDYLKACSLADKDTKNYFEQQAQYIERVRKEWIERAKKEKPYDIFICYKDSDYANGIDRTKDSIAAQDLYIHLTEQGYRVFFSRESLRDKVGEKYEPYIFNALSTAKVMLVYGSTPDYITSTWLKNEWTRYEKRLQAGEKKANSLIVACDGFSPAELPKALSSMQCLDATKRSFYTDLDAVVKRIIKGEEKSTTAGSEPSKKKNTRKFAIALASIATLIAITLCILFPNLMKDKPTASIVDSQYGITITSPDSVFDKNTTLNVTQILEGEEYSQLISTVNQAKSVDLKNAIVYDIECSTTITKKSSVKISYTKSDSDSVVCVYYVSDDKTVVEEYDSSYSDGVIEFQTEHFSIYIVGEIIEEKIDNSLPFEYEIKSDNTIAITKYTGNSTTVTIPNSIDGKKVTELSSMAFDSMDKITSISIPDGVTAIGAKAFYGCTSITSLTIPSSVVSMGTSAFYGWTNSQEIILEGLSEVPSGWNAQWNGFCNAKIVYGYVTIVYNSNGGSGLMNPKMVESDAAAILDENRYTLTGYTFIGWSVEPNGEVVATDKGYYSVGKDSVYQLYAVWTANENKVVFNSNSGMGTMNVQIIRTHDSANLKKCLFTKSGYTFAGWALEADGDVVYTDEGVYEMGTDREYVLYAIWVSNNNMLLFNSNNGVGAMDSIQVHTDEEISIPKNRFTKEGYTFVGWSKTQNGVVDYSDEQNFVMTSSATMTLYAVWQADPKTLTLYANNGTSTNKTVSMESDMKITLPQNTFSYSGYTFLGWSTTASGSVEYVDKANYTIGTKSTQLYAIWQPNTNTLSFNANGGTGSMTAINIKTDAKEILPPCDYMYHGYVFAGWSTSPNGSVIYSDKAEYTMGANSSYTLYALWELEDVSDYTYTISGNTATITGYTGTATKITIPLTVEGRTVTKIGDEAFSYNTNLKEVTIPEYIAAIGNKAFWGCTSLEQINYNAINVTSVGSSIFAKCGVYGLDITIGRKVSQIPAGLFEMQGLSNYCPNIDKVEFEEGSVCTIIGKRAFYTLSDAVHEIKLPESLLRIEDEAFGGCGFKVLEIPSKVTYVGSLPSNMIEIYNRSNTTIKSNKALNVYTPTSGCSKIWYTADGFGFFEDGNTCYLVGYFGDETTIVLPQNCNGKTYDIYTTSFANNQNIYSVTISSGVKNIQSLAFEECYNLRELIFEEGVEYIGGYAFSQCDDLVSYVLPQSLKSTGSDAFLGCRRSTNHYKQENIKIINDYMFYVDDESCLLLAYLGSSVNLTLPEYCEGREYTFARPFQGDTRIESIVIPDTIYSVPANAFNGCVNLKSVTLPNTLTTIGSEAFADCASLKEITIPKSVVGMPTNIFCGTPIKQITYVGTVVEWNESNNSAQYQKYGFYSSVQSLPVKCSDGNIE